MSTNDTQTFAAFFTGGPLDGQVLSLPDPVLTYRVTRPRAMVRIAAITDDGVDNLEYGEYKRGKVTRNTSEMNLAIYHWGDWV